jgi:S-formylglutathione hydrolase FrmB
MGGSGTWSIGLRHPDLFAALVPVRAVVDPRQWIDAGARIQLDAAGAVEKN